MKISKRLLKNIILMWFLYLKLQYSSFISYLILIYVLLKCILVYININETVKGPNSITISNLWHSYTQALQSSGPAKIKFEKQQLEVVHLREEIKSLTLTFNWIIFSTLKSQFFYINLICRKIILLMICWVFLFDTGI